MKANEFVKKFGWGEAQKCLPYCSKRGDFIYYKNIEVNFNDLKRLVESHRVIEACGGIHMARADVMDLDGFEKTSPHWMKIKQAILDVESCQ